MDGRILPNGQYRDGQNVQISRSEGDDVGALETVLGNNFLSDFGFTDQNLTCIGKLMDDTSNKIFLFLTNYTDSSPDQLSNNGINVAGVTCYIVQYNISTGVSSTLVSGNFLNFSKTHIITGINLLEDLLFWTDNRNQPRKINVNLAITGYYTTEDQISVAKYYPYEAPLLLDFISPSYSADNPVYASSMTDTNSKYLPIHTAAKIETITAGGGYDIRVEGCYSNIKKSTPGGGIADGNLVTGLNATIADVVVDDISIDFVNNRTEIKFSNSSLVSELSVGDILYFQFLNPDYDPNWPGDPEFLKEKFARFSYRFRFDDGEYSLSAPFSQLAFVPEQDGYFIGDNANGVNPEELVGQESETFDSTIVKFMENKITNIKLCLVAPTKGNGIDYITWDKINEELKITDIDILYKEAQSNKTTILDTLKLEDFGTTTSEYLYYDYQSRKPWKTLSTTQSTRVTDLVPVKALAQEVSGNRVIYGNFINKHTSPESLSYTLQIGDKPTLPEYDPLLPEPQEWENPIYYVRKEYQNHTLKQNRTYQVGVVLSDRYGRQSNVILSDIRLNNTDPNAKGSTIYHAYKGAETEIIQDKYLIRYTTTQDPDTWPGDMLNITFENVIPKARLQDGYPGVYSVDDGSVSNCYISSNSLNFPATVTPGCEYNVVIQSLTGPGTATIKVKCGTSQEVLFVSVVDGGSGWVNGETFEVFSWPVLFGPGCDPAPSGFPAVRGTALTPVDNPLGWYSYKIVIKQQEQEYYNVYLPGALAGYPCSQNPGYEPELETEDTTVPTVTTTEKYAAIPHFEYPEGQATKTTHIVLFSDNINKVPRDLQEVGPLQEEFRSKERLYFRVNSILEQNPPDYYTSIQYNPSPAGDKVITLANMSKLSLGDLTTAPQTPIIPNLFYKGDTDPLIGRVQTTSQIGISKYAPNSCTQQFGPTSTEEVPANTKYGFGPTLAVAETKPVESLLDLFYETTTSGLISDLNFKIENEDNTIPAGLTETDLGWNESDDYGTVISADFQAVGSSNNPLGNSCTISLSNVIDGTGAQVNKFEIEEVGVNTGIYRIKIKDYYFGGANGFICGPDPLTNIFYFTLAVKDLSTSITTTYEEIGEVQNRAPIDRGAGGFTNNLRTWMKSVTCNPNNNLAGYNEAWGDDPRVAQEQTFASTQGEAKYGLSECTTAGCEAGQFDQFLIPESNIVNGILNYGVIKSSGTPTYYDWQLGPAGSFEVSTTECGGDAEFASPVNRGGSASGFRNFGYFGIRNYYNGTDKTTDFGKFSNESGINGAFCGPSIQLSYYWDDDLPYRENRYPKLSDQPLTPTGGLMPPLYMGSSVPGAACEEVGLSGDWGVTEDWQPLKTMAETWDGTFTAGNGAWGSSQTPPESFPFGGAQAGIGGQIEWSIPRMYQVSMMVPFGPGQPTGVEMGKYCIPFLGSCQANFFLDLQPAGEVVFGLYQDLLGTPPSPTPLGQEPRNSILTYMPSGPIYWENNENQLNSNLGGESIVGERYNLRTDVPPNASPSDYPHHYWPDLNRFLRFSPLFAAWRNNWQGNVAPKFMTLQNGANTFYQWNHQHSRYEANTLNAPNAASNDEELYTGEWAASFNAEVEKNTLGYLFYLGGLDPTTKLGLLSNMQKFFAVPEPPPSSTSELAKCKLHAGSPGMDPAAWNTPDSYGNGMPGGRYVVTLRATDKSGQSDGLYYEWDVPVYLPWWATRTNAPIACAGS